MKTVKHRPNWLTDNDWSHEKRLDWIKILMVFDSRDWSIYPYATGGKPDQKSWAIFCLSCFDTKKEATRAWQDFNNDLNTP